MGDIGSPTRPHSHVLNIKTWVLKTWEVEVVFWEKEKKEKKKDKSRGGESKRKETRERKVLGQYLNSRHSLLASSPPTPILHTL